MSEEPSKRELYPRVADFYDGKSVLITGAAGFVGMVLLEILLRTCPGVKSIYILIREKKGVKPEERKDKLFQKPIFDDLKRNHPDALDKVILVPGDIAKDELGLSQDDIDRIIRDVSIVFHAAADINFVRPMKYLMEVNALGTLRVVELCKKLNKLDALVFTSTLYSNCNRDEKLEEIVYRLPFPSEVFFKECREGTDESVDALVAQCYPRWQNSYTFNKCLAENLLLERAFSVPCAIIRPSIVCPIWKAPLPGYSERNNVVTLIVEGSGKGFLKVIPVDPDNEIPYVPVDIVANVHIIAAWKVATQRCGIPYVINCTRYGPQRDKWGTMLNVLENMKPEFPVPKTFQTPDRVTLTVNPWKIKILTFYEHYVPAYAIDLILKLSGKKLRLVKMYNFFDKAMVAGCPMVNKKMTTDTTNFQSIADDLDERDKETFYIDFADATVENILEKTKSVNEAFDWNTDKLTKEQRKKKADQRARFTKFIQYCFLVITFTLFYFITSTVYSIVV